MTILKTPIPKNTLTSIEQFMQNKIDAKVAAGVYVVRLNGGIDRFDNISNTPIQDAINSAVAQSTGVGDYVWCNNWIGFSVGKMEQNIVLKNYVNMRFDGGNIFSDSTDNTPLFTDNGVRASIVITGNPILGRYGGAGDNNRCVFKLDHVNSFIRSNSYMVIDSTLGSQNSIISNGNMYLGGDNTIVGGIKITNGNHYITSNRDTTNLVVSGGAVLTYKGVCNTITKSGSGSLHYTGTNNSINTTFISGGLVYINNVKITGACNQSGGEPTFTDCTFEVEDDVNYTCSVGNVRFINCLLNTTGDYNIYIPSISTVTIDNCKFIGAVTNSIFSDVAINIVNYNSYATINKNSNVTLLVDTALTISANVR